MGMVLHGLSRMAAVMVAAGVALLPGAPRAMPVELELVLAVDTSASISGGEFVLQMQGIAQAFRNRQVVEAVEAAGDNGIAVTLLLWSSSHQQAQAIGWTHVDDAASAARFADAVVAVPRQFSGDTAIGNAIRYAAALMEANAFEGRRLAIDVSGDGRNNSALEPRRARDRYVPYGITINGLAIEAEDRDLGAYFEEQVIGGTGAFVIRARDFDDFARAIARKLLRELASPLSQLRPAPRKVVPDASRSYGLSGLMKAPNTGGIISAPGS